MAQSHLPLNDLIRPKSRPPDALYLVTYPSKLYAILNINRKPYMGSSIV